MDQGIEHQPEKHRQQAFAELRAELAEFSWDGLIQLEEDLRRGAVVRGSWGGCVMSYKRGDAGSSRRDRLDRARNAFTVLWDNGWLTDEDVRERVNAELASRRAAAERTANRSAVELEEPAPHPA